METILSCCFPLFLPPVGVRGDHDETAWWSGGLLGQEGPVLVCVDVSWQDTMRLWQWWARSDCHGPQIRYCVLWGPEQAGQARGSAPLLRSPQGTSASCLCPALCLLAVLLRGHPCPLVPTLCSLGVPVGIQPGCPLVLGAGVTGWWWHFSPADTEKQDELSCVLQALLEEACLARSLALAGGVLPAVSNPLDFEL